MNIMEYENDFELCEYNPISIEYQKEIQMMASVIEKPAMSFFERLMKKIVLTYGTQN
jgi:hypothetical protein